MADASSTEERAALGRIANLGDLYDARTDIFCGITMLKKQAPASAITLTDNDTTDTKFIIGDSIAEKFNKLDIAAELSVSILAGLFTLDGSGKYVQTKKDSRRTAHASLLYNINTRVERLNLFSDELLECISHEALSHDAATHVVVQVSWGANSLLTVKDQNQTDKATTEVEGKLSAQLKKLCVQIRGSGAVDCQDRDEAASRNYSFEIFGDLLPESGQNMPNTVEDAIAMMRNMPAMVQKANQGKGKPLKYVLFPLSAKSFRDRIKSSQQAAVVLRSLESSAIKEFVNLFSEIALCSQEVYDFIQDVEEMEGKFKCVPPGTARQMRALKDRINVGESQLRDKLAAALKDVRSGRAEMRILESLLQDYKKGENDANKLRIECRESYWTLQPKYEFAKLCQELGVNYVTDPRSIENDIRKRPEVVALYASEQTKKDDEDKWRKNDTLFFRLARENRKRVAGDGDKGSGIQFFYVDCDFDAAAAKRKGIRIERYRDGECINEDMTSLNVVERGIQTLRLDKLLVPLVVPCPGDCDDRKREWFCGTCKEPIRHCQTDGHFYCGCGRTLATRTKFRCIHRNHGLDAVPISDRMLKTLGSPGTETGMVPQLNVLVLGTRGVGKSTWINSLANFFSFGTLEEAERSGGLFPVPISFTVADPQSSTFKQRVVSTAADVSNTGTGSRTNDDKLLPRLYSFLHDSVVINVVDTPGVGGGVTSDKLVLDKAMLVAAALGNINLVCVLLKSDIGCFMWPNDFNCVTSMLGCLDQSALSNVVFCLTNAKGANFKPDMTLPVLSMVLQNDRKFSEIRLSPKNVYCFDSEPIRYLAVLAKSLPVDDVMKQSAQQCWNKSLEAANKLIEHAQSLKPTKITSL